MTTLCLSDIIAFFKWAKESKMEFQTQFFCTFLFGLISNLISIWYQNKKVTSEKNRNEREEGMKEITLLIKNNKEKEIRIRNLTEENDDLRKMISEQSEVISELYVCRKKLADFESSTGEKRLTWQEKLIGKRKSPVPSDFFIRKERPFLKSLM